MDPDTSVQTSSEATQQLKPKPEPEHSDTGSPSTDLGRKTMADVRSQTRKRNLDGDESSDENPSKSHGPTYAAVAQTPPSDSSQSTPPNKKQKSSPSTKDSDSHATTGQQDTTSHPLASNPQAENNLEV